MRIYYKRALSGKMVYTFPDYPSYELHFRGSDYQIKKNHKVVKYLDSAYGHTTCLDNAYKYIKEQSE